jgi:hypothetical protein
MNYWHTAATATKNIAAAGSSVTLVAVNVNTGATSAVLTVYDGIDSSGAVVATVDASAKGSYWFGGVRLPGGLYVALTGGNADVTVSYG